MPKHVEVQGELAKGTPHTPQEEGSILSCKNKPFLARWSMGCTGLVGTLDLVSSYQGLERSPVKLHRQAIFVGSSGEKWAAYSSEQAYICLSLLARSVTLELEFGEYIGPVTLENSLILSSKVNCGSFL